jgi:cell division protein FtsB
MDLRVGRLPKVRILPNPEDGLRTLVERAPQAEAWADRMMQKLRPYLTMLYAIRRRIATGAIAALAVWMFVHVTFGANGMVVYQQKKGEYQSLQKEIRDLQHENDRSSQQIKALESDPKAIEKEAREQLRYARPGEVIYVSPPKPTMPPSPPQPNAARK